MNERIQELAIQSGFSKYKNDDGIYSPYIEGEWLNDELQEFAELIVKDCVDIMGQQIYNTSMLTSYPPKSSAIWDARNEIFKKYGIKS